MMRKYQRGIGMAAAAIMMMNIAAAAALEGASGTKTANCVVRILSPRETLPINPDVIERLLTSSPVIGEPLREILGSKALSYEDDVFVNFEALEASEQKDYSMVVGIISVDIHGGGALKAAAEEFLAAICERMEEALGRTGEVYQERLLEVEAELESMKAQYERLNRLQRELMEQAGQDDLSRDRIVAETRELQEQIAQLRLKLAAAQAREEAVTAQIARVREQMQSKVEQSPVVAEMRSLIDLKERELAYRRKVAEKEGIFKAGPDEDTAPMSFEVVEAETELIEARMHLARYLAHEGEEAGTDLLEGFNRELIELGVQNEMNMVELGQLEQRLAEIRERRLIELADRYEHEVEQPLDMIRRMMHELVQEQFMIKEKIRSHRMPVVTVIGG